MNALAGCFDWQNPTFFGGLDAAINRRQRGLVFRAPDGSRVCEIDPV